MSFSAVEQLLKENQTLLLKERRRADRVPFVRPVLIHPSRGSETFHGFTRDFSKLGVGVISPTPWEPPAIVTLDIHSLNGRAVKMKAESQWCNEYGEGWYLVGFAFR